MKVPRRYNWYPVSHEEMGTGLVLFAMLVAIVVTFCG